MPMRRKSTEEDTSQLDKSEDECGDSGTRDSNDDSMYVCVCVCVCVCARACTCTCECAQSRLTPSDPTDCSPPVSSVHEIFQARVLEWVAIPFSRGSSWPRDGTWVSCIAGRFFTLFFWATREAYFRYIYSKAGKHGIKIGVATFKFLQKFQMMFLKTILSLLLLCYL